MLRYGFLLDFEALKSQNRECKVIFAILRWVLMAWLLYGVYTETGIWTTVALGMIMATKEVEVYLMRRSPAAMVNRMITEWLERHTEKH
jgi:hypothetical protein